MKELQRHRDAFELYLTKKLEGIDTTQAITQVSLELSCSESSIYNWKKKFNWDEREAIRSAEIQKEVEKRTNATITENKVKYLSFYHKLLDDLKNNFNIKIENTRDLKLVVDGALNLQGEATERSHNVTDIKLTNFDKDAQKEIIDEDIRGI